MSHWVRGTIGVLSAVLLLAPPAGASPDAEEILHRVLTANADTPDVVSADAQFRLRVRKPLTAPPDCEFDGTMQLLGGYQSMRVGHRTSGLLCWAVDQYVLGRLFEASEPLAGFLKRFQFHVLGEKLVDGDRHFLLQGTARDPKNNPRSMMAWVDYERGLVTDGFLEYSWGTIDTEQRYSRVQGAWMVVYQYLYASRFDASLEVSYSDFRFAH
jgi:hypothetical protein